MDFGPEGTPCLSAKLFWAMEFLGRGEGTGCFIQHILWLPLLPCLALSSVKGRIVPPVLCALYFTVCDSSCWDGRFLVVEFLGQGGHSHCLPGAQHPGQGKYRQSTVPLEVWKYCGERNLPFRKGRWRLIKSTEAVFLMISHLKPPLLVLPHLYYCFFTLKKPPFISKGNFIAFQNCRFDVIGRIFFLKYVHVTIKS